jgi:hypothetical protein
MEKEQMVTLIIPRGLQLLQANNGDVLIAPKTSIKYMYKSLSEQTMQASRTGEIRCMGNQRTKRAAGNRTIQKRSIINSFSFSLIRPAPPRVLFNGGQYRPSHGHTGGCHYDPNHGIMD